jgi:hypothetical protein
MRAGRGRRPERKWSDMPIDTDAILRQALADASKPRADGGSELGDFVASIHAVSWLQVLAAPHAFTRLGRVPSSSHLLKMVDDFLLYVRRGDRSTTPTFTPVPYELREERALVLRGLLEAWDPQNLTAEVVRAARDVLEAEGLRPEEGWDNLSLPPGDLEERLFWPESTTDQNGA